MFREKTDHAVSHGNTFNSSEIRSLKADDALIKTERILSAMAATK